MLRSLLVLSLVTFTGIAVAAEPATTEKTSPLQVKMKTLDGKEVDLAEKYKGKVVLIVNVASKCGLTPQYKQLQALQDKYGSQGLAVAGFPCNQFGKQEPGSSTEISEFCTKTYGVKFDMFEKVDVNTDSACELYKTLTSTEAKPEGKGDIKWNFEKFLIGRDGQIVARFSPRTKPDDKELIAAIEKELSKK
jgi:glutathione peroxidase